MNPRRDATRGFKDVQSLVEVASAAAGTCSQINHLNRQTECIRDVCDVVHGMGSRNFRNETRKIECDLAAVAGVGIGFDWIQ